MSKKSKIIEKIINLGIVAVVRAPNIEEAIRISGACINGGILAIEVTYTVPNATQVIENLKKKFSSEKIIVGAGTVLDVVTARIAILAGAEYIVSPFFDKETAKLCNLYQIPYMPGCLTITEMKKALEYGVEMVKLFPSNSFGPSLVKAIKVPLPQLKIMPTGGVSLANVEEWFKNGVAAIGVGGKLMVETSEEITSVAKQFITKINNYRNINLGR